MECHTVSDNRDFDRCNNTLIFENYGLYSREIITLIERKQNVHEIVIVKLLLVCQRGERL